MTRKYVYMTQISLQLSGQIDAWLHGWRLPTRTDDMHSQDTRTLAINRTCSSYSDRAFELQELECGTACHETL